MTSIIAAHPSNGSWKNTQFHFSEELCVDDTSTKMRSDNFDACSLADTVFLVYTQK
jgi:hypothetical protein